MLLSFSRNCQTSSFEVASFERNSREISGRWTRWNMLANLFLSDDRRLVVFVTIFGHHVTLSLSNFTHFLQHSMSYEALYVSPLTQQCCINSIFAGKNIDYCLYHLSDADRLWKTIMETKPFCQIWKPLIKWNVMNTCWSVSSSWAVFSKNKFVVNSLATILWLLISCLFLVSHHDGKRTKREFIFSVVFSGAK